LVCIDDAHAVPPFWIARPDVRGPQLKAHNWMFWRSGICLRRGVRAEIPMAGRDISSVGSWASWRGGCVNASFGENSRQAVFT
jgi:hypothetical protein